MSQNSDSKQQPASEEPANTGDVKEVTKRKRQVHSLSTPSQPLPPAVSDAAAVSP